MSSPTVSLELSTLADSLEREAAYTADPHLLEPFKRLEAAASSVGRSFSGSWLGYHATVYYARFALPPAAAQFSAEWGLERTLSGVGSRGDWSRFTPEDVMAEIQIRSQSADISELEASAAKASEAFEETQSRIVSRLSDACRRDQGDTFLSDLLSRVQVLRIIDASEFLKAAGPRGQLMSRDSQAATEGIKAPPHEQVIARLIAAQQPGEACRDLAKLVRRAATHLSTTSSGGPQRSGNHVFIGHGRSPLWKDLRDFLRDRVHLPFDEFNRVPVAGVTNIARLSQMLDSAAVAFVVMTAEDEQLDGSLHARMNVIHEVGLFQGRLGFDRAIVLLEQGCEEFTNIQGLGQIRFPKGNITACFEDVRLVLEREGLIG